MKYWRKPLDQDQRKPCRYRVHVLRDRCKGCRLCIEFCPRQVFVESKEFNAKGYRAASADKESACLNCGLCELICPEFAIAVAPAEAVEAHG